ncbi:MAG: FAD:protein FMN transferase [Woeseiaceae bacterium]
MQPAHSSNDIRVDAHENYFAGRFDAMASPCEVLVETDDPGEAYEITCLVAAEAWRIEEKFSRYLDGNIISRINRARGKPVEVDEETAQLIDFAEELYDLSKGTFDITSGVLRRVWRFDGSDNLPARNAVKETMKLVGWKKARWETPRLTLQPGMEIDLGGIGKEYAVDRCANVAKDFSSAACLINFGGDLAATRQPDKRDGWKVGVESVSQTGRAGERLIILKAGALATSGDARRFLLRDGIRYSHIVDPKTGWPVPEAPRSVTVAADTCTEAGMLSTLAMLKGAQAESFLDAQGVRYWCNRGAGATP